MFLKKNYRTRYKKYKRMKKNKNKRNHIKYLTINLQSFNRQSKFKINSKIKFYKLKEI